MSLKFYRERVSSIPESDTDSYIVVKKNDIMLKLIEITWHNPKRLDPMVEELNAVLKKYKVYKE